jgi:large subunit ribosomal protein L18
MVGSKNRREMSVLRHRRLRKRVSGTAERPRLAIFRSGKHIYAQIIDDGAGRTLAAASSLQSGVREGANDKSPMERAAAVGEAIAANAKTAGVSQVVFDRGGFKYHGRIKALAEAAREAGLKF